MHRLRENADIILFNYQTTHKTSFREDIVPSNNITVYEEKPHSTSNKVKKPDLKYVYTMMNWKSEPAPFDVMMIEPKQIIRTNPHGIIPTTYEIPRDLELDEVRKTRPRLVMTPAVSMDDVDDTKREVLLKDIYTTDKMREYFDRGNFSSVKSPLPGKYAPPLPTALHKYKPDYISPEWRMQSVAWDHHQHRGGCEPTKRFWLSR